MHVSFEHWKKQRQLNEAIAQSVNRRELGNRAGRNMQFVDDPGFGGQPQELGTFEVSPETQTTSPKGEEWPEQTKQKMYARFISQGLPRVSSSTLRRMVDVMMLDPNYSGPQMAS